MPRSLYLHIPFCPKICPYCDFHKMRRNEGLVAAYLKRLEAEATALYGNFPGALETIYLGGGTPSHLSDSELQTVSNIFTKTWGWPAGQETTLEADPLTFDKARLQSFRELGFNRLSIGLQSTQDKVLQFLGRRHNAKEGLQAVELALEAGFDVSADLITAVTGQDTERDLRRLAETGVPHISVYNLTIEPSTPFARRGVVVDEDKEADDYLLTNEVLSRYGLERYEVSSHAKPGHESKHNQVYWRGDYFLALGPSAAGFVPPIPPAQGSSSMSPNSVNLIKGGAERSDGGGIGIRYTNKTIKAWLESEPPEILPVSAKAYVEDVLMTGLRTRRGVDIAALHEKTGIEVRERYEPLISKFEALGWLEHSPNYLRATASGLMHLNHMVATFFNHPPENRG